MQTNNDQNNQILNKFFKFKEGSSLKSYISKIRHKEKLFYTLGEILAIIKNVIREERMFDYRNPSVILCTTELEQALDRKALHVAEVRNVIMDQIEEEDSLKIYGSTNMIPESRGNLQLENPRHARTMCVATNIITHEDAKFRLKPLFLVVVQSIEGMDQRQTIFKYKEIAQLLSRYILSKKDIFFDYRNVKVAIVKGDPLGDAFGVSAFHKCQFNTLLRSQLIPIPPDNLSDKVSNPEVDFPQNSVTLYPTTSTTDSALNRKRVSLDEQKKSSVPQKQSRQSVAEVKSSCESKISDSDIETSDEDTDSSSDSNSDIEYDIESEDEEVRPPQAHGRGNNFSSADNTDSDINDQHLATYKYEVDMESLYWADSEDEKGGSTKINMEIIVDKISKCNNCFTPTHSRCIRYCSPCWKIRKNWIPERKRSNKSISSVTADQETTSTQISETLKQELTETSPDLCTFCHRRSKNAIFIHGNLGHQVCCYPCAKKCWKQKATCPICMRKVEKIVKIIQS